MQILVKVYLKQHVREGRWHTDRNANPGTQISQFIAGSRGMIKIINRKTGKSLYLDRFTQLGVGSRVGGAGDHFKFEPMQVTMHIGDN